MVADAGAAPVAHVAQAPAFDWAASITAALAQPRPSVQARTFVHRYNSVSQPVIVACDDGFNYIVKARPVIPNPWNITDQLQSNMMFADQVVARVGAVMTAAVPVVTLVDVPAQLIALNTDPDPNKGMGHILPGLAHGSRQLDNVTENRQPVAHVNDGDNKRRYAALSILFGLAGGNDHQFLFGKDTPFAVWSHDHGHFFPGGPNWTCQSLAGGAVAIPDPHIHQQAGLQQADFVEACKPLKNLTCEIMCEIAGTPPQGWNIGIAERVSIGQYIWKRCGELMLAYP